MELTSQELAELYAQIENKSDEEIESLINNESEAIITGLENAVLKEVIEFEPVAGALFAKKYKIGLRAIKIGDWFKKVFDDGTDKNQPTIPLIEICKDYVNEFSNDIKAILKNNPKTTNYALNVIQLLVPAIAQQYSGIPAMAIVGSITLLCRQGLENFIK